MTTNQFINMQTIQEAKKEVKSLFEKGQPVTVVLKKSKARTQEYEVNIVGTYQNLFTVENTALKLSFGIQYVDLVTGAIKIKA